MMRRIEPTNLRVRPFHLLDKEWALLVSGVQKPNPMTVSWGGFGTLWNRPVVTVYVRPSRHSYRLMNDGDAFTLNVLPASFRSALDLCGSSSGRDTDKWAMSKLHARDSTTIAVPGVLEAKLLFECRTLATLDIDPSNFRVPEIGRNYSLTDYHRAYVGEVLAVFEAEDGATP